MSPWLLAALHLNTASVQDLHFDGEHLWVATGGGLEVHHLESGAYEHVATPLPQARLRAVGVHEMRITVGTDGGGAAQRQGGAGGEWAHLPTGEGHPDGRVVAVLPEHLVTAGGLVFPEEVRLPGHVQDAVHWKGALVAGTLEGELLVWRKTELQVHHLGAPVMDLAVVAGEVRVACAVQAAIFDGEVHRLDIPATAAGPLWGTGQGALVDERGVVAHVPAAVTAVEALGEDEWAVGTEEGLYRLGPRGLHRLTPDGGICGDFLTDATMWKGRPVVSTFSHGACWLDEEGRWQPVPDLPSSMVNDVLSQGEYLWLATSGGLARWDGREMEVYGPVQRGASRYAPGLHHQGANGLARGDRLWVADVLGPVSIDGADRWRRHRYAVWGTSNQAMAACGAEAWISSEDAGVSRFDGRGWDHWDAETGLPDDWIMDVACDGRGRAWAGTYQDGVWAFDGQGWSRLEGIGDDWILSLHPTDEALWVGTMGGLYLWHEGTATRVPHLPYPAVHGVWTDDHQALVATEAGLAVYRRGPTRTW